MKASGYCILCGYGGAHEWMIPKKGGQKRRYFHYECWQKEQQQNRQMYVARYFWDKKKSEVSKPKIKKLKAKRRAIK